MTQKRMSKVTAAATPESATRKISLRATVVRRNMRPAASYQVFAPQGPASGADGGDGGEEVSAPFP